jgi:NADPH:quinone reductase-like Zn-dependent oxidoreductase
MMRGGSLHGIFVGDRTLFEQLVAAIDANAIKPVIDKVFGYDQVKEAFLHQQSGDFIGKIVIQVGPSGSSAGARTVSAAASA